MKKVFLVNALILLSVNLIAQEHSENYTMPSQTPLNWHMSNDIAMIPESRVCVNTSDIIVSSVSLDNEEHKKKKEEESIEEIWNSLPGSPIKDQPLIITPHEQNKRYSSETLLFNPMRDNEKLYKDHVMWDFDFLFKIFLILALVFFICGSIYISFYKN